MTTYDQECKRHARNAAKAIQQIAAIPESQTLEQKLAEIKNDAVRQLFIRAVLGKSEAEMARRRKRCGLDS